jgi:hypothetical protein
MKNAFFRHTSDSISIVFGVSGIFSSDCGEFGRDMSDIRVFFAEKMRKTAENGRKMAFWGCF